MFTRIFVDKLIITAKYLGDNKFAIRVRFKQELFSASLEHCICVSLLGVNIEEKYPTSAYDR